MDRAILTPAGRALRNLLVREARWAAGPDGEVSREDEERLPGFLKDALEGLRTRRAGAPVRVDDLADHATVGALRLRDGLPRRRGGSDRLTKRDVEALAKKSPSLGPIALRAYQNAEATKVRPKRPANLIRPPDLRQDTDYTCGAAALQSVLVYYGKFFESESDLALELRADPEWGTDPKDLVRVAERYGLHARIQERMTFEDLERNLERRIPVIVAYQAWQNEDNRIPWDKDWDDGHYSIITGLDGNYVFLEDPSQIGEVGVIPRPEFMERWHDIDRDGHKLFQCGIVITSDEPPFRAGRLAPID